MRFLPLHPVPMKTSFRHCFLVNFAVAFSALRRHLPDHLVPDQYGPYAFVSIVIALMDHMRPSFVPPRLGTTYTQVVYRAVVRCGRERGVTFLRSDADNAIMVAAGNAFTFFRFNRAHVNWQSSDRRSEVSQSRRGRSHRSQSMGQPSCDRPARRLRGHVFRPAVLRIRGAPRLNLLCPRHEVPLASSSRRFDRQLTFPRSALATLAD